MRTTLFKILLSIGFIAVMLIWFPHLIESIRHFNGSAPQDVFDSSGRISQEWQRTQEAFARLTQTLQAPVPEPLTTLKEYIESASSTASSSPQTDHKNQKKEDTLKPDLLVTVGKAGYCVTRKGGFEWAQQERATAFCLETVAVTNRGGTSAEKSSFSANTTFFPVSALKSGEKAVIASYLPFARDLGGGVVITFMADARKEIPESNEENNTLKFP